MNRLRLALITSVATLSVLLTSAQGQQAPGGLQPEVVVAAFSAEITGTVKSVNPKSGKLVLDTVDGPVNVGVAANLARDEVTGGSRQRRRTDDNPADDEGPWPTS
jgi:hypothetical protein